MAGSYDHITTRTGNLRTSESFVDMVENLGDAYEAVEELYGMVWWLARQTADPDAAVRDAQLNYAAGLSGPRGADV